MKLEKRVVVKSWKRVLNIQEWLKLSGLIPSNTRFGKIKEPPSKPVEVTGPFYAVLDKHSIFGKFRGTLYLIFITAENGT